MSRFNYIKKNFLKRDPIYNSFLVNLFVSVIIKNGKKCLAYSIIYKSLNLLKYKVKNVLQLLELSVKRCRPNFKLKELSSKKGFKTALVKSELFKSVRLAVAWIIFNAFKRSKKSFFINLANEIYDAANRQGLTYRQKKDFEKYLRLKKTAI